MSRLRWPLRVFILAVLGTALAALTASAAFRGELRPIDTVLFAVLMTMAAVAQLWPVHLSVKMKITVDDTATFAAALLLGPFYSMILAGGTTLIALHFRGVRQRWYNRGFNAATAVLSTGAAATVFLLVAGPDAQVVREPWAIGLAAIAKYLLNSMLVDVVVALQMRRNPLAGWWTLHRRLLPYEAALLVLGALAAIAAQAQPWTLVLFGVPMAIVLFTVRDSARVREQTKSAILELADLIDLRDPYTHGHSQRVAGLAERLAKRLRLEYSQVELIRDAARVHDIGKIGTNDLVLLKPGPLTDEEQREMRRHTEIGHKLLRRLPEFWEGAELVLSHHERHDGAGYPRGLKGDELPIEVSVISVADTYDAMTTDRPYRKGLAWDAVRAELVRQRGKQWRERAVDCFIEMIDEERRSARVDRPEPSPGPAQPAAHALT
ncbi:MAG TPA: HD domain-containing phosphohydrolase [Candidatus Polarisedimenticolia bacterium]|nr:HD domain-containing phosphohydrolase [Candidatus Polarisedimenticolia bacterium]